MPRWRVGRHAGGAVHGGGLFDERVRACVEQGLGPGGAVALEAYDERFGQPDLLQGPDDAVGDRVAGGDAAEDVDEDGLHGGVGEDDRESVGHDPGGGAAADVEEVRGPGTAAGDHVERRHDQARAVADDAHLAVEPDVVQASLAAARRLQRVRGRRPLAAPTGLAEGGVVIEGDLSVESHDAPCAVRTSGLTSTRRASSRTSTSQSRTSTSTVCGGRPAASAMRAAAPWSRPRPDRRGSAPRPRAASAATCLISVPPSAEAIARKRPGRAVEDVGDVELPVDVDRFGEHHRADGVPLDVHAEDPACRVFGCCRVGGEPHSARLAPPAGFHLRLDDGRVRRGRGRSHGPGRASR